MISSKMFFFVSTLFSTAAFGSSSFIDILNMDSNDPKFTLDINKVTSGYFVNLNTTAHSKSTRYTFNFSCYSSDEYSTAPYLEVTSYNTSSNYTYYYINDLNGQAHVGDYKVKIETLEDWVTYRSRTKKILTTDSNDKVIYDLDMSKVFHDYDKFIRNDCENKYKEALESRSFSGKIKDFFS